MSREGDDDLVLVCEIGRLARTAHPQSVRLAVETCLLAALRIMLDDGASRDHAMASLDAIACALLERIPR